MLFENTILSVLKKTNFLLLNVFSIFFILKSIKLFFIRPLIFLIEELLSIKEMFGTKRSGNRHLIPSLARFYVWINFVKIIMK